MKCQDWEDFVDAYLDNELDAVSAIRFQAHLDECMACQEALGSRERLQSLLRRRRMRFEPPPELRLDVVRLLKREAAKATAWRHCLIPPFAPLAATVSLAFVAGLAWFTTATLIPEAAEGPLVAEITASHIRSLLADHLLDVSSSDQHTVKPWFDGKTEYSPPVKDLAAQGFRLAGGRLDYVNNRHVAVLVYEHHKQVINLFICPASSKVPPGESTLTQDGYHLVRWTADGMNFWAVSDAATDVLRNFRDTIRE